jgi:hypothetical protein
LITKLVIETILPESGNNPVKDCCNPIFLI